MMESIIKRLEYTREKMIQSAIENGVTNRETIRLSEEIDHLLNEFHSQVKQLSTSKQID